MVRSSDSGSPGYISLMAPGRKRGFARWWTLP
jgi:hypothetical protein